MFLYGDPLRNAPQMVTYIDTHYNNVAFAPFFLYMGTEVGTRRLLS